MFLSIFNNQRKSPAPLKPSIKAVQFISKVPAMVFISALLTRLHRFLLICPNPVLIMSSTIFIVQFCRMQRFSGIRVSCHSRNTYTATLSTRIILSQPQGYINSCRGNQLVTARPYLVSGSLVDSHQFLRG